MKRFECVVPGSGIRSEYVFNYHDPFLQFHPLSLAFGRAVHCLAKIGEEIFFEASQDLVSECNSTQQTLIIDYPLYLWQLSLKTVNGARSAYACFLFKQSFFNCYNAKPTQWEDRGDSSSEQLSIKLALKVQQGVYPN